MCPRGAVVFCGASPRSVVLIFGVLRRALSVRRDQALRPETTDPVDETAEAEVAVEVAVEVDAAVEETPLEGAPVEEAPVEDAPVDEALADEPEPEPEPEPITPPEPPEPPKVVTRTRRRAASRPAGPPPVGPAPEAATGAVLVDEAGVDGDEHDHHESGPALHVPVKRRGSRKR